MFIHQLNLKKLAPGLRIKYFLKNGARLVYIESDHGFWNPGAKGYTDKVDQAWKLMLKEAYSQTEDCGPEKKVVFHFVDSTEPFETAMLSNDEPGIKFTASDVIYHPRQIEKNTVD